MADGDLNGFIEQIESQISEIFSRQSASERETGEIRAEQAAQGRILSQVASDVRDFSKSRQTNWPLVFGAIALLGGIVIFLVNDTRSEMRTMGASFERILAEERTQRIEDTNESRTQRTIIWGEARIQRDELRQDLYREVAHRKEIDDIRQSYIDRDLQRVENRMNGVVKFLTEGRGEAAPRRE